MKTLMTLCYCVFVAATAMGQTVNGIPLTDLNARFIEITGQPATLFSTREKVSIDFGQAAHTVGANTRFVIKDQDGQPMVFNTMVGALNFMTSNGYQFVQAYVMRNGDVTVCHYLMKKKDHRKEKQRAAKISQQI